jgi:hypothetical protein
MTRFAFIAASGLATAMLGGCVIVDADVRDSGWDRDGDFGYLYGAEVSERGPDVTIIEFDVGFRREREDNCKALVPEGRRMTWSFAELGLPRNASVFIINPVGR